MGSLYSSFYFCFIFSLIKNKENVHLALLLLFVAILDNVGGQNLPSQNVSLWDKNQLILIIFKASNTQEETLAFSLTS